MRPWRYTTPPSLYRGRLHLRWEPRGQHAHHYPERSLRQLVLMMRDNWLYRGLHEATGIKPHRLYLPSRW